MSTTPTATTPSAPKGINKLIWLAQTRPFSTNIVIATLKTALCDYLVQRYIERKETIDWRRNAVFWAFGAVYLGGVQWFIYVTLFKRWWPGMATFSSQTWYEKLRNAQGIRDLGKQVAFDNFVHYPVVYFPVFYILKQSIQDPEVSASSIVRSATSKYWQNGVEDNVKMWLLWVPGDIIVYSCPLWMRLPLNHLFSLVWTCYLSFLRGGDGQGGSRDTKTPCPSSTSA